MKIKSLIISLMFFALAAVSISAQSSNSNNLPLPSNGTFVTFSSCFYLAPAETKKVSTILLQDFEILNAHNQVCDMKLAKFLTPVFFGQTATMKDEKIILKNNKIETTGLRQNLKVTYNGRTADTLFLTVKINDQPEQIVSVKENEVAFVAAGLLDSKDAKSHGYLAFRAVR